MADILNDDEVTLYEHFFRDPQVGDGVLQPPHVGLACRNLRDALRYLGYHLSDGSAYDGELQATVQKFQTDQGHKGRDGLFGPGTRKLLTRAILAQGQGFFRRGRMSPEYSVFLSYSRKNEGQVVGLVEGLKARGIPVFRDKEAIPGGASWPDVLHRSIRKCQVFLCILTPQSADSLNVLIEVALARHANRPIVPVLLQATELSEALGALLGHFQYVDLSEDRDPAAGVVRVLESLLQYGVKPQPKSP